MTRSIVVLQHNQAHGMGMPVDAAGTVLHPASDDGRRINGATITMDNGETAG